MTYRVRRGTGKDAQMTQTLLAVKTKLGLPTVQELQHEVDGYMDVLLGREPSPIDSPYLALMEVATAYFARANEIDILIHRGEREGVIFRGDDLYKFRTGELRSFLELSKKCAELGSRRLTQEELLTKQRLDAKI